MITRQPNGSFPKTDFWKLTDYRGQEVSRSIIEEVKPDVLVVAAGGTNNVPKLPGISRSNVVTSRDLHRKLKIYLKFFGPRVLRWLTTFWMPLGKRVVIMGGGCRVVRSLSSSSSEAER
jgi:hypothetical protein